MTPELNCLVSTSAASRAQKCVGHWRWRAQEELEAFKHHAVRIAVCGALLWYVVLVVTLNAAYFRYGMHFKKNATEAVECFETMAGDEVSTLCVPRRLPDLGYEMVPEMAQYSKDHYTNIPLFFLAAIGILSLAALALPPRKVEVPVKNPRAASSAHDYKKPLFVNVLVRAMVVYLLGHLLRACTYLVTTVPGAADHCLISEDIVPPTFAEIFYKPASSERNCGDLVFSGHLLITLSFVLVLHRYAAAALQLGKGAERALTLVCVAAAVAQTLVIVSARHHYSIDCVVAWYVTPLLWHSYNAEMPEDFEPCMEAYCLRVLGDDARDVEAPAVVSYAS
eukprot:TRINITY_DN8567_c0_g1_i1.p1 TRINITY_DN8567_c0_g1~~TRINITY_DN8567_c0_g1_i1.p1  ORF type:complete len:337 (+),score=110.27 TRINITY_DN8567_c0_g1_i1:69-1079(+)